MQLDEERAGGIPVGDVLQRRSPARLVDAREETFGFRLDLVQTPAAALDDLELVGVGGAIDIEVVNRESPTSYSFNSTFPVEAGLLLLPATSSAASVPASCPSASIAAHTHRAWERSRAVPGAAHSLRARTVMAT